MSLLVERKHCWKVLHLRQRSVCLSVLAGPPPASTRPFRLPFLFLAAQTLMANRQKKEV